MSEADELSQQLADELHDGVVQWLVGAKMQAEGLKYHLRQGQTLEPASLDSLIRTLTSGIHEARRLMRGLSGPMIEGGYWCQPLRDELLQIVQQLGTDRNQVAELHFDFSPAVEPLSEILSMAAYRLIREAVWNALRHAKAKRIQVKAELVDRVLVLSVKDDGSGFDPTAVAADRMGVRGLRRRAESLGGTMQIATAPSVGPIVGTGAGTKITFSLPVTSPTKSQ